MQYTYIVFFELSKQNIMSQDRKPIPKIVQVKGRVNVTLVVEMKDKEFTSYKAKYALQFGTNIFMVGLSLSFKS